MTGETRGLPGTVPDLGAQPLSPEGAAQLVHMLAHRAFEQIPSAEVMAHYNDPNAILSPDNGEDGVSAWRLELSGGHVLVFGLMSMNREPGEVKA